MTSTERAPRKLLVRGAKVLRGAASENTERADIFCVDGAIAALGPALPLDILDDPTVETLDASGCLAVPGLVNAHLHSPGNLMRGTLEGLPLEIFMLYEVPPLASGVEDPEIVRLRTLLGAAEMIKLGVTSVIDDAFFVPLCSTDAIDALAGAYVEIGMRATIGLDQPIVVEYEKYPFLADLLPATLRREMDDSPRETEAGMAAHYAHLVGRWHGAGEGLIGAMASCSAPQRATPSYLAALDDLSRRHDLPFSCHVLETKLQRVLGEEKYGKSLVALLDDLGALSERMQVIHAIWIDDVDIARLARSGAMVAHNPVCNLRLGSGVMPFRALADAGVPICLGTDEAVSDDSHDVWGALKLGAILHAIATPDHRRWPSASELLGCLWDGGDRALRRSRRVGRLEPGAAADIALLEADAGAFTPLHDIRRQLVLCETASAVRHTVIDGRVVLRDRCLTTVDEGALKRRVRALEPELRASAATLRRTAGELEPFYHAMLERAHARDVGFTRWVGR